MDVSSFLDIVLILARRLRSLGVKKEHLIEVLKNPSRLVTLAETIKQLGQIEHQPLDVERLKALGASYESSNIIAIALDNFKTVENRLSKRGFLYVSELSFVHRRTISRDAYVGAKTMSVIDQLLEVHGITFLDEAYSEIEAQKVFYGSLAKIPLRIVFGGNIEILNPFDRNNITSLGQLLQLSTLDLSRMRLYFNNSRYIGLRKETIDSIQQELKRYDVVLREEK